MVWGKTRREVWTKPEGCLQALETQGEEKVTVWFCHFIYCFFSFLAKVKGEFSNLLQDLLVFSLPTPKKGSLCNFTNKCHVCKASSLQG